MSSLGEAKLFKLINSCPQQLVEYNRHQMMRVYPAGRRVDSSNYNPIDPWLCGCSMGKQTVKWDLLKYRQDRQTDRQTDR